MELALPSSNTPVMLPPPCSLSRCRMPFLPSDSTRHCVRCARETWSLEGAWHLVEGEVAMGARTTSTWSRRSARPCSPRGGRGAGGRGLHLGGGADHIGTGRGGEWDRHTLTNYKRTGNFLGCGFVLSRAVSITVSLSHQRLWGT